MAEEKTENERPVEERRFDYPRKEWQLALFCYWLFPLLFIILYSRARNSTTSAIAVSHTSHPMNPEFSL